LGLEVVREIVERTIGEAGLASVARDQIALGLGLAGLSNAADAFRVTTALPGWARSEAVNDAVTACIGVAEPLREYLPTDIAERLHAPRHDAVDGAILLVGGSVPDAAGSGRVQHKASQ
jgi:hypothetical protein